MNFFNERKFSFSIQIVLSMKEKFQSNQIFPMKAIFNPNNLFYNENKFSMQVVFSMKIYFQCKEFSKKNLKVNSLK